MAKYTIEDSTLTAVADNLREKTGTAGAITPEEMPDMVGQVFEAGEKSEWDRFWDSFQLNGRRTFYDEGFGGSGWNPVTFRPKYDLTVGSCDGMFRSTAMNIDLVEHLSSVGVKLLFGTFSSNMGGMFSNTEFIRVGEIGSIYRTNYYNLFAGSTKLETIDKLISTQNTAYYTGSSGTFYHCYALKNLVIDGVIGKNNFNVSDCTLLTHDSLMSIINALEDKTGTSGTWTITLGEANLAKLSEEEIGIAEEKGWVLA